MGFTEAIAKHPLLPDICDMTSPETDFVIIENNHYKLSID